MTNPLPPEDPALLRDRLAVDRTALANERTLLAYGRTALTLLIAGVTFVHLEVLRSPALVVLGWVFMPLGVVVLAVGITRYRAMSGRLGRTGLGGLSSSPVAVPSTGPSGQKPD
jgi:putative membrane protein